MCCSSICECCVTVDFRYNTFVPVHSYDHGFVYSSIRGLRLNFAHNSAIQLVRSTVVVHAEEGVVDRVENAVGGAAEKVNDTALASNDKVQDATSRVVDFMSGKADEAHNMLRRMCRAMCRGTSTKHATRPSSQAET